MKHIRHAAGLLRPLQFLLPAVITAVLVFTILPLTVPVLADVPERLELETTDTAAAAQKKPEVTEETEEMPEAAVGNYPDGVYTGSARGWGGTITVSVTIKDGKIAGLKIVSAPGETPSYLSRAKAVIDRILNAGSPNVDAVSGATYSSNGIINATKRAMNQAAADGTTEEEVEEPTVPEAPKPPVTEDVEIEVPANGLKDGTYTASAQGFGGQITVSVTITDGKLTGLEVLDASAETPEYLDMAMAVVDRILKAGSPNVDVVSGATYTSNGIINATKRAMNQAAVSEDAKEDVPEEPAVPEIPNDPLPEEPEIDETVMPAEPLKDGVYTGCGEGWGGEIEMQVTVRGGRIIAVKVVRAEDETPIYFNRAKSLISDILCTQRTDVDTISGATFSSEGILEAVDNALAQAVERPETPEKPSQPTEPDEPETPAEPEQPDAGKYADGVYSASGWCEDEDGYFRYAVTVTVTVEDGRITAVDMVRGTDESEDPEDNDKYIDYAVNGRTRKGVTYPGVPQQIIAAQSPDGVDAVSGATYTSEIIRVLAAAALGEGELPPVNPKPDDGETPTEPGAGETPTEPGVGETPTEPGAGETPTEPGAGETPTEPDGGETPTEPDAGETPTEPDAGETPTEPGEGETPTEPGAGETPTEPDEGETPTEPDEGETPTEPGLTDGTYSATGWCADEDEYFRYKVTVTVTVKDGKITAVDLKKGVDESEDPEDNDKYIDYAVNGRTRKGVFYPGVPSQIIAAQSAAGVDAVSGATYTSVSIRELAAKAIAEAGGAA